VPIDFHDDANRAMCSGREADTSSGGAVLGLGAATVTGVDVSGPILEAAR
jgi:hypothetical protein